MLRLDVGTMAFSAAIVSLAAAIVILAYRDTIRSHRYWQTFSLCAATYGIGVVTIILRGTLPPFVAIIGGNLLVMVSALLFHAGICAMFRRQDRPLLTVYAALTVIYLAAETYYFTIDDSINARIVVISALRIPVFAHAAILIHRHRATVESPGALMLEIIAGLWAALLVPRIIGTLFLEGPIHEFVGLVGYQAAYFAASGLGNVFLAVGLQRIEAESEMARLGQMVDDKTKALERELAKHAESETLVRTMLDASADAAMLFRRDGSLLAINDVMAQRFGIKPKEIVGQCLWDLFPADVSAERRKAVLQVLDSGVPIHTEDRRDELYLANSIYPVMGPDGLPDKAAVFSRDITTQKIAETKIANYLAEVERSNAELEEFAYVASHDLREPLRMISSYLSLLQRRYGDRLDKDGLEFLDFARDGAVRMDRLVLDLLDFSRIERKGSPMVAMAVSSALATALRQLSPAIDAAKAIVETDSALGTLRSPPTIILAG